MPDALTLWHALCSGTGRHLLGFPGSLMRQAVSPKSWIPGRKLRISNCSPESQKKEQVSPPGCYRMNFIFLSGYWFPDAGRNLTGCTFIHLQPVFSCLWSARMMFSAARRLFCNFWSASGNGSQTFILPYAGCGIQLPGRNVNSSDTSQTEKLFPFSVTPENS